MIYSEDRKRALNYVIEELKRGENGIVPYVFIFGDFNFRLHLPSLLEVLGQIRLFMRIIFSENNTEIGSTQL